MDEPHVPDASQSTLAEVQWRWEALRRRNPHYYDGRVLHVLGVSRNGYGGAVIHVADCAYRYFAVQNEEFDLGVRPLGAKGLTQHEGKVLLGLRSATVGAYQGMWEFAPAGVVEPGRDPAEVVLAELSEETGLRAAAEPTPIAVLFDNVLQCWEIAFRIVPEADAALPGYQLSPATDEYDRLVWREPDDLPDGLSPAARLMIPLLNTD